METEKQRAQILNDNLWKILIDFSWPAVIAMFLLGASSVSKPPSPLPQGFFTVNFNAASQENQVVHRAP